MIGQAALNPLSRNREQNKAMIRTSGIGLTIAILGVLLTAEPALACHNYKSPVDGAVGCFASQRDKTANVSTKSTPTTETTKTTKNSTSTGTTVTSNTKPSTNSCS